MKYIFQAGDMFVKLKIDRTNKKFELASSKTGYRFIPQPYWKLFGSIKKTLRGIKLPTEDESKKEMAELENISDEEFESKIIKEFFELGYTMIKKCR